jgi:hypothetical protein
MRDKELRNQARETQCFALRHPRPACCGSRVRADHRPNAPNKANLGGRGPRLGIADLGLGIRGRRIRARRVDGMPNKANPGRGGLGIDYGLLMIWGQAMAVAGGGRSLPPMRQTKPILKMRIGFKAL